MLNESLGKGAQGGDGFPLAQLQGFPLAGLCAGPGENLPCAGATETHLAENTRYISPLWVCHYPFFLLGCVMEVA